ncbi:MAG: hypothetical protein M3R46_01180 [Actinomycetota bacterium]|nr:hypothetical protein [Actinomycetota bacterium]
MRHLGSPLDVVKHEVVSTVLAGDGDALHAHLSGAAIQIAAADYIFYLYGSAWEWRIPTAAINGWLTATVVQVVSVVLVTTRYLFPKDGFRG